MQKLLILISALLSISVATPTFADISISNPVEKKIITVFTDKEAVEVTDGKNITVTRELGHSPAFIDESGITFISFEYLKYIIEDWEVYYKFDYTSKSAYTQYKSINVDHFDWISLEANENDKTITNNGHSIILEYAPVVKNEMLYLPLRETLNALGYENSNILYNPLSKSIQIQKEVPLQTFLKNSNYYITSDAKLGYKKLYTISDYVYYYKNSENYVEIEKYIQDNINSDFNLDDYTIAEDDNTGHSHDIEYETERLNLYDFLSFAYNVGDSVSDFGYYVTVIDSKVVLITEFGNNITGSARAMSKEIYSDEELIEMSLEYNKLTGKVSQITKKEIYKNYRSELNLVYYGVFLDYIDINGVPHKCEFEYTK